MLDIPDLFNFPGVAAGPAAIRCFGSSQTGSVIAVFRSTFYIVIGDQLICIANGSVGPGPLNIITVAPPSTDWSASGVRVRMPVAISRSEIRVGSRFVFPLSRCKRWSPILPDGEPKPGCVRIGLDTLRVAAAKVAPHEGLGRYLAKGPTTIRGNVLSDSAAPQIASARTWVIQMLAEAHPPLVRDKAWVRKIAGLGPGLTPSGDDFLAGMMIALHRLDEAPTARLLWRMVEPIAQRDGNAISLAHLAAAAEGFGAEAIECTISAVLRGDGPVILTSLNDVAELGHTSGWDAMVGVGVVLDGWLDLQYRNRTH
jgi:hypothetical protein